MKELLVKMIRFHPDDEGGSASDVDTSAGFTLTEEQAADLAAKADAAPWSDIPLTKSEGS
jgi:hypothetical protein